ncbi:ATP-binding cassette domain-containing protein [Streptomyces sp. NPDC006610]|uniref:ATP-binding cassette domain-containing protein n=1 Tax=Streptomyces sp. NPDC006610 TaxID=3154584 RepID=UPI0033BF556C
MQGGTVGLAVSARDFGLKGPRGWAFRDVSLDAAAGSLIAVEGPSGSGRTCLLLALTGRMRATAGTAAVGEARLPKRLGAVRRVTALAHVPGVTDLDPALTVGEHLRERALLQRRFGDSLRALLRPRRERSAEGALRIDSALRAAGLDREALPKGSRTAVRDLGRLEALRLSVALALMGRPEVLGVDDTGLKLSEAERAEVWELLRSLADAGTTVVAVCSQAPPDAVVVRLCLDGEEADDDDVPLGRDDDAKADDVSPGRGDDAADDEVDPHDAADPHGAADPRGEAGPRSEADHDEAKETADALAETGRA